MNNLRYSGNSCDVAQREARGQLFGWGTALFPGQGGELCGGECHFSFLDPPLLHPAFLAQLEPKGKTLGGKRTKAKLV